MRSIRLPAFKRNFIFATLGSNSWKPTVQEVIDLVELAHRYKISAVDLNKLQCITAQEFPKIEDAHEYVFLLYSDEYSSYALTEADINSYKEIFAESGNSDDEYLIIVSCDNLSIKRMKKNLIPFL